MTSGTPDDSLRAVPDFVDAHIHLWDLKRLRYPWLTAPFDDSGPNGSVEPIARNYAIADYLNDAGPVRVTKMVHVDAGAHPDDALGETQWLQAMADTTGFPNAIIAYCALEKEDAERRLSEQAQYKNVRGIRQIANWHEQSRLSYTPHNLLIDQNFHKGFALLRQFNLSFDLQLYPTQMLDAYRLVAKHSDVVVIINHMGMPIDQSPEGVALWDNGLKQLAQLPNVAIKISGMGFVDRGWSQESMRPTILKIIDYFGVNRCAFASDFPTDKLFNPYAQSLKAYDRLTQDFSDSERTALFSKTAETLYRI